MNSASGPPKNSTTLRGKKILIVEDDPLFAEAIALSLKQQGILAQVSRRLPEALLKINNQSFDCILLDLHLEVGDGEAVVERIRADKRGNNFTTPVLVMSGFLSTERLLSLSSARIQGALVKPFEIDELIRRIERCLGI